jgi:hypothetical protein
VVLILMAVNCMLMKLFREVVAVEVDLVADLEVDLVADLEVGLVAGVVAVDLVVMAGSVVKVVVGVVRASR